MTLMEESGLSQSEKRRGRSLFGFFQAVNALSYIILCGNLITLYVLRLGGSGFYVGLISSIQYVAFFFMFVGKWVVGRTGIRNLMGGAWLVRNLCMVPMIFSPLFVQMGYPQTGLLLVFLSSLAYHIVRGVGIISFNPMIGAVSEDKYRGDFLSRLQIINYAVAIVTGLLTAWLLGKDAPLIRYTIFIIVGIAAGLYSAFIVFRFPEAPMESEKGSGESTLATLRRGIRRKSFVRFCLTFLLLSVMHGMVSPFIITFARDLYGQSDRMILLFSVGGSLGAMLIGFLTRLLVDRVGSKPLYILFSAFFGLTIIPLAMSIPFSGAALIVYLSVLFFFNQIGIIGGQITAQNYFFGIITQREHLNMGIIYNLLMGIAGIAGSLLGGLLLDLLKPLLPVAAVYRIYFGIPLAAMLFILAGMTRLESAGRYSIMDALSIIFSPRDLRAVSLLKKLDKSSTVREELETIQEIADSQSEVAVEDLLQKLKSPRFQVRYNALRALEQMPVSEGIVKALISEVKNHHFTTAYVAARILGEKGIAKGRGALRQALASEDYLLQSKAIVSLALIGARDSIPTVMELFKKTDNPMVKIHCVYAMDILKCVDSIPILIQDLKSENPHPFVRDEIILSLSGILGMEDWFYPLYTTFCEKAGAALVDLADWAVEHGNGGPVGTKEFRSALKEMQKDRADFGRRMKEYLEAAAERSSSRGFLQPFIDAVDEPELLKLERFCFLNAAIAVFF